MNLRIYLICYIRYCKHMLPWQNCKTTRWFSILVLFVLYYFFLKNIHIFSIIYFVSIFIMLSVNIFTCFLCLNSNFNIYNFSLILLIVFMIFSLFIFLINFPHIFSTIAFNAFTNVFLLNKICKLISPSIFHLVFYVFSSLSVSWIYEINYLIYIYPNHVSPNLVLKVTK